MKHLRFRILVIGVVLPPVLYILTLQAAEQNLKRLFNRGIEKIFMGNPQLLLNGSIEMKEAVSNNIERFIENNTMVRFGLSPMVTVTTKNNTLIYPLAYEKEGQGRHGKDAMTVAAENVRLMNEGLVVNADVSLPHHAIVSRVILFAYIILDLMLLYVCQKRGAREDREKRKRFEQRLKNQENAQRKRIQNIEQERENLRLELLKLCADIEKEKSKASANENELINDIVLLENKIAENLKRQDEQTSEIGNLKEKLNRLETERKKIKTSRKPKKLVFQKRFATLYKNLLVNERAIESIISLGESMQIKCEEIISQLNDEPGKVPIKRKVFGKKNREAVLEVVFGYKGRIYYRTQKSRKIEILAIGTKNTQTKDLEFLNRF